MARPKPDWERESVDIDLDLIKTPLRKGFREKVIECIGENHTQAIRQIELCTNIYRHGVGSIHKRGSLSTGQQIAAAKQLAKDSRALSKKLAHDCGGLIGFLKHAGVNTKEISISLDIIGQVCLKITDSDTFLPPTITLKEERIKLAKWIAFILEENLQIKATAYMSSNHGAESIFAKLLRACIDEAQLYSPANLTSDMATSKKAPLPPRESDYWIKLSEKELNDIAQETIRLIS